MAEMHGIIYFFLYFNLYIFFFSFKEKEIKVRFSGYMVKNYMLMLNLNEFHLRLRQSIYDYVSNMISICSFVSTNMCIYVNIIQKHFSIDQHMNNVQCSAFYSKENRSLFNGLYDFFSLFVVTGIK